MSIMSELTVHKTALGYRLFRKPVDEFKKLRKSCREHVGLNYHTEYKAQTETVFTLRCDMDATVLAADLGFKYIAKDNKIITTSFKEYTFADRKDIEVRIIADRRSIEMFLNDEIVLTFSAQPVSLQILNDYYKIWGTVYELESIWEK